jgi:hypothetical protein
MRFVLAVVLLFAAAVGFAQDSLPQMQKLSWLVGSWKGTGTIVLGPNEKREFVQVEDVQTKLGGIVITIDGLGVDKDDEERVVHQAFGVINYDVKSGKYGFKPYLADGRTVDAKVVVSDNKFEWSMEAAKGVEIRYTITLSEKGEWHEVGEMSRDGGKAYFKFFEMDLEMVAG